MEEEVGQKGKKTPIRIHTAARHDDGLRRKGKHTPERKKKDISATFQITQTVCSMCAQEKKRKQATNKRHVNTGKKS